MASRQHGVVTHGQLVALGLTRNAILRRVATGRLHVLHRGVYAVGHAAVTHHGIWLAAVFACGESAVLSHRPAAELWGIVRVRAELPHVTVPRSQQRRHLAKVRRHSSHVPGHEVTRVKGIPVTTVPRTLLDFASVATRAELARAFRQAEAKRWVTPQGLKQALDRHPGRRGNASVRAVLADAGLGTGITRSDLEAAFTRFLRRHQLPPPARNVHMRVGALEIEADCVWAEQKVIVELDSRTFHDTGSAFESDRARDRALTVHGWTPLRITWRHLERDELQLARDLRSLLLEGRVAGPRRVPEQAGRGQGENHGE